jgi:hypothetical protein
MSNKHIIDNINNNIKIKYIVEIINKKWHDKLNNYIFSEYNDLLTNMKIICISLDLSKITIPNIIVKLYKNKYGFKMIKLLNINKRTYWILKYDKYYVFRHKQIIDYLNEM